MSIEASTTLTTEYGDFRVRYHENKNGECVSFSQGDLSEDTPIIRLHSACLFGEAFHSQHCDCYQQLTETMELIRQNICGAIVYSPSQEGRGIGLKQKIRAMEIQRTEDCDTVEVFAKLGLGKNDYRTYDAEIDALAELKTALTIRTFSGNPEKISALQDAGYTIAEQLKISGKNLSAFALKEIETKKYKMGYQY
jgi:GTP cyclohydrolase II